MITINLSDEQGRELLSAFGWRDEVGRMAKIRLDETVAAEIFRQVENQVEAQRREGQ